MNYLVRCQTPDHAIVYLNPLHIVVIEPLNQSDTPTRIRLSISQDTDAGQSPLIVFSTEPTDEIARRVEAALHLLHHPE
jgi:hypothetical protein